MTQVIPLLPRRLLITAVALATCGVALIAAAACWHAARLTNWSGYANANPQPLGSRARDDPWAKHRLAFEEVTLMDDGRGAIYGWLIPGAAGATRAVVFLHGQGDNRTTVLPLLPMLHEAGASVLAIDLRGRSMGLGMWEAEDADRAVAELWRRGYRSITLMGVSLGASAAIIAGARNIQVAAVIAEDPVASFSASIAFACAAPVPAPGT